MKSSLKNITNIGIPCYDPITLSLFSMTLNCSFDKSKSIRVEREIRKKAIDKVNEIISTSSKNKNIDYLYNINFYSDISSKSRFDILKKQKILNIFSNLTYLNENDDINTLINNIMFKINDLEKIVNDMDNSSYTRSFRNILLRDFREIYDGKKERHDTRDYIKKETNYYNSLLNNLDEILKINYIDLFDYYTDTLNSEKVAIFLANSYLEKANQVLPDYYQAQKYLFYVSAFLKESISKKVRIIRNNKVIDYDYIECEYKKILNNYNMLKDIVYDRDIFIKNNIKNNIKVIDSLINMKEIIVDESFIKSGFTDNIRNNINRNNSKTEIDNEKIKKYLQERYYTYLKNSPIAKIQGEDKFSNYIGFLYLNGMIPADRLLNITSESDFNQDAIYVFDILNFDKDIKLDKQILRSNPRIKTINHINDWQNKVDKITKLSTSEEMHEKAKEYIKTR